MLCRTGQRPQATCTENLVKFGHLVFEICWWTDRHTDIQTNGCWNSNPWPKVAEVVEYLCWQWRVQRQWHRLKGRPCCVRRLCDNEPTDSCRGPEALPSPQHQQLGWSLLYHSTTNRIKILNYGYSSTLLDSSKCCSIINEIYSTTSRAFSENHTFTFVPFFRLSLKQWES